MTMKTMQVTLHAAHRPVRRVRFVCFAVLIATVWFAGSAPRPEQARADPPSPDRPSASSIVYLPLVANQRTARRVNAPYLNVANIPQSKFSETAIFWLGRVTTTDNYVDVRVGYNDSYLFVRTAIFDRRLWYDTTPAPADMMAWDATTLYLNLSGNTGSAPVSVSYRFDVQINNPPPGGQTPENYKAAYQGNGSGWTLAGILFDSYTSNRWESATEGGLNNNENNRGWGSSYYIPFTSLGLSGPPLQGTVWGLALAVHDRDDQAGTPIADKVWPETMNATSPATWGQLRLGLPTYTPPAVSSRQTITIRHRLNGADVPDGGVGGYTICGNGLDVWSQWGEQVYYSFFNSSTGQYEEFGDFNIQNQSDYADWPCFSKYYITFPLSSLPTGQTIVSATLTLHQFGNSDPSLAKDSLIQVMTVAEDWNETTLAWNNAPLALENVSRAWAPPVPSGTGFPGALRTWDVSRAVVEAYSAGKPLRLVLYSADGDAHSGKYFVSSDTGDWNAAGRPALIVTLGTP